MKKIILFTTFCILFLLSLPSNSSAQTVFDLVWSPRNQVPQQYALRGASPLTAGSEVVFSAQPQQKSDLSQYEFNWFVNNQKQTTFSGSGRNYFILETLPQPTVYEVVCQIKESGQIIQSESLNFFTKQPELLVYRTLPETKTEFFFKKTVNGTINIQEGMEALFKTIVFGLNKSLSPMFSWQLDQEKTKASLDNAFLLQIPELEEGTPKQNKSLKLQAIWENSSLNKQINLFWQ